MSSDIEILHDFLKNPISLDLEKLKYGRGSASLTTDSGREIKLPIFDANEIFQKVNFFKNQKMVFQCVIHLIICYGEVVFRYSYMIFISLWPSIILKYYRVGMNFDQKLYQP